MFKKKYCLLILVLAVIVLMAYQSRFGPVRAPRLLNQSVNYANGALDSVYSAVRGFMPGGGLSRTEAERLKAELSAIRLREPDSKELALENRRLREALDLKERLSSYVATARVISRGGDRWSNAFVIDKGKDARIEKGMAAITPDGLLGKVQEVYDSHSLLLLIDDRKFSAAVRLQDDRAEAIASGAGASRLSLKYVETDMAVEMGQILVTSGLDGLFPPGLTVGYVSKISTKADTLFHDIEVTPFAEPRKAEEVVIVKR